MIVMMTNIVGLMLIAATLIMAISAELLQSRSQEELEKELFDELDKRMTSREALAILELVDVDQRDEIKIGNCSISYILSYKDYSCTFKQLSDPNFLKDNCSNTKHNLGVKQFIKQRIATRHFHCSENYYSILQEAIADIQPEDRRIVEGLFDTNFKKWSFRLLGRSNGESKKDQRIKTCVKFIHKLSFMSMIRPWATGERAEEELHSHMDWNRLLEACRRHMEKQCEPYYRPLVYPPHWVPADDKNRNDGNIELRAHCHEIIDSVASEETYEKNEAEMRKTRDLITKREAELIARRVDTMTNQLKPESKPESVAGEEWLRDSYNDMHPMNRYESRYLKFPRP